MHTDYAKEHLKSLQISQHPQGKMTEALTLPKWPSWCPDCFPSLFNLHLTTGCSKRCKGDRERFSIYCFPPKWSHSQCWFMQNPSHNYLLHRWQGPKHSGHFPLPSEAQKHRARLEAQYTLPKPVLHMGYHHCKQKLNTLCHLLSFAPFFKDFEHLWILIIIGILQLIIQIWSNCFIFLGQDNPTHQYRWYILDQVKHTFTMTKSF